MNQRSIGIIILVLSFVLGIFVYSVYSSQSLQLSAVFDETGSCFTDDGTCLHESRSLTLSFGVGIVVALLALGVYLIFFDSTQRLLVEQNVKIASVLESTKSDDRFVAFLSGFNDDEQKVLRTIHDNDGITQSTLRFKLGMPKASLSLLIQSLEKRGIISRKVKGKTFSLFLKKF